MFRLVRRAVMIKQFLPISNTTFKTETSGCFFLKRLISQKNVYLVDEDSDSNNTVTSTTSSVNKFTNRTHSCGELNQNHIGQHVTLCGWLEFQRMKKFLILRDSYGQTQLIVQDKDIKTQELIDSLPFESILQVQGSVIGRPIEMRNSKQSTGDIEVLIENILVLNPAERNLPFNIREFQRAKEALRMQYRYLDLRFPQMQRNLRVRSELLMKMREYLINHCGFVDVETPTLFKATPGGAQEFVVPTRFPNQFYSLVQSPQQFKQMLMAGAIDKYFQIARCYRDEGARPDRQPEFTQLDIEMSFTSVEHIFQLIEELLNYSWPKFLEPLPKNFDRISFADAMETYGSDQPDTRFDFLLQNCTNFVQLNPKLVNTDNFAAYYILFSKEYAVLNKSVKEKLNETGKKYPNAKLVQVKFSNSKELVSKLSKLLTEPVALKFVSQLDFKQKPDDSYVMFLTYGKKLSAQTLLGKIRVEYADFIEDLGITTLKKKGMHFLWVLDFPLFEINEETNELQSAHHPFTSPNAQDLNLLETDPLKVRSLSFDLVLNGNEVGGGSVRIHDPKLQNKILELLKIDTVHMKHILEMLSSGCPPHGGIALGLDRLLSKILKTKSIRDVIAFPKSFEGKDLLSGAPSEVGDEVKKLYHIKSVNKQ